MSKSSNIGHTSDEDELVRQVENRLLGHIDNLLAGDRVEILGDEVIPNGTLGTVSEDYILGTDPPPSLRVLVDQYVVPAYMSGGATRLSTKSVWCLNRWQVGRVHR